MQQGVGKNIYVDPKRAQQILPAMATRDPRKQADPPTAKPRTDPRLAGMEKRDPRLVMQEAKTGIERDPRMTGGSTSVPPVPEALMRDPRSMADPRSDPRQASRDPRSKQLLAM